MEKKITAFVRDAKTCSIAVQVILPRGDEAINEFEFLWRLGFQLNQVESDYPDYLNAEFETADFDDALRIMTILRDANYF